MEFLFLTLFFEQQNIIINNNKNVYYTVMENRIDYCRERIHRVSVSL